MLSLLSARRLYTAVPTSGGGRNIEFDDNHGDITNVDELDKWWETAAEDGEEGQPSDPTIDFALPRGIAGYPSGNVRLEFVKYEHDRVNNEWSALARLLHGPTDEPTGIIMHIFKDRPRTSPQVLSDAGKVALDPERPGRLAMQEEAHAYAILSMIKIEKLTFEHLLREAFKRDERVSQEGPDNYYWEIYGRLRNFNQFIWSGAERLLRSYVKDPKLTDADLDSARLRLEGHVANAVAALKTHLIEEEGAEASIREWGIFVKLPLIKKGDDSGEMPTPRTRITPKQMKANRRERATPPQTPMHAGGERPRKSYRLSPQDEQDIDAAISAAIGEVQRIDCEAKQAQPFIGCSCANCGCSKTDFRCSRCKKTYYCSDICQREHWNKSHEHQCGCGK